MRFVSHESSSRERVRRNKGPDVRSPQGGAQGSLKGCQGFSQEKDGRGAHRGKAFRVAEIVGASRCLRWKRSRPSSKKRRPASSGSRGIEDGDGRSEVRSLRVRGEADNAPTRAMTIHRSENACRETRVSPASLIGRSKLVGELSRLPSGNTRALRKAHGASKPAG